MHTGSPQRVQERLAQAEAALGHGDPSAAHDLAMQVLGQAPGEAHAQYIAGRAAAMLGRIPQALEHLHRAASLQPRRAGYLVDFARELMRARRSGDALQIAHRALPLVRDDPAMLGTLGLIYTHCQAHERAGAAFRRAALLAPNDPICRFNHAMALAFGGEPDRSEAELEACLALAPDCWPAHALLSRLRRQTPERNHVERLNRLLLQAEQDAAERAPLHMALGKEHEDLGDYERAFRHFVAGKAAKRHVHDSGDDAALVQALIDAFPDPVQPSTGYRTDEPIFVVGMPRSGTTLLDRILSSHPEVHSAGELENFGLVLGGLSGHGNAAPTTAAAIVRAREAAWEALGEQYLLSTRPATSLKPRFVDKFPHNFLYLGFIARALPDAKIVCLRRHPLDTCLGNLREPFMDGSPFHGYASNLEDIGRYYIQFDRLMAHWKRVLPGRILEIPYESLVTDQETVTRRLLDHCELPWNEACLHFEHNRAPTTTASALQVRAPLHRGALGRWRNYAPRLEPLRALLTASGIDCE